MDNGIGILSRDDRIGTLALHHRLGTPAQGGARLATPAPCRISSMSNSYGGSVANRLLSPMVSFFLAPNSITLSSPFSCSLHSQRLASTATDYACAQVHDLKPQDRQGTWQAPIMQQMHTNSWTDSSMMGGLPSHRIATPQFTPHTGSGGPVFMNMNGSQQFSSMPNMNPAPPMARRNDSGGQPSWLQGGSVPPRVPSATMDVFASTGGSVVGAWGLSQSAEMLSISEDNAQEYRHLDASQYPVYCLHPPTHLPQHHTLPTRISHAATITLSELSRLQNKSPSPRCRGCPP